MKKIIGWTLLIVFVIGISIVFALLRGGEWWYGLVSLAIALGIVGFLVACLSLITSDE
ncbi:MAG TPA: hypothetical protein VGK47_06180 [Nitrososphaeraceae archaeon]